LKVVIDLLKLLKIDHKREVKIFKNFTAAAVAYSKIGIIIGVKTGRRARTDRIETKENFQVSPLLIEFREEIMVNLTFLRLSLTYSSECDRFVYDKNVENVKCAVLRFAICSHSGRGF
jgi:hypothetical protein